MRRKRRLPMMVPLELMPSAVVWVPDMGKREYAPSHQSHPITLLLEVWSYPTTSPRLLMPIAAPPRSVGLARGKTVKRPRSYINDRDGRLPTAVWMVPTIAPQSLMPNTRIALKSWLGRPGGTPKLVSTPLDHS